MTTATKARPAKNAKAQPVVEKKARRKPEPQPEPEPVQVSSSRSITELRYQVHDALENASKPLTVNALLNMFPDHRSYLVVRLGFMLNRGDWAIDGFSGKEADAKDERADGNSFKLGSKIVAEGGKKAIRIIRKLKRRQA